MPDTINPLATSLDEAKISELPVADAAHATDRLEASQVDPSVLFVSRSITLDQVSTVVAASDQITDIIDAAVAALPPPVSDWADITGKPTTFPPDPEAVDDRVAALLVAGTNVTLNYNDVANSLTINSTGGGGGAPSGPAGGDLAGTYPNPTVNPEAIDDRVAALIVAGANMTATYNDAAGTLTLASTAAGGGGGTVTSTSVVNANGFDGTVATATTTPAITMKTTVSGMLKGNGTAISAATAGTDYMTPANVSALYLPLAGGTLTGPLNGTTAAFTGEITAATPTAGDNDTSVATTAFVTTAVSALGVGGMSTAEYTYSTTLTPPPATGQLRGNSLTQSAITNFYLSDTNALGVDITNALKLIAAGVKILVQDKTNASNVQYYLTSGAAVDNGTYFTIPVTWSSTGSGSSFTAGRVIFAGFGIGSNNMPEAPTDGSIYGRRGSDTSWQAAQPLDADLTALAGLNATAGLVEQTGAAAFTKRLMGVANATDVLTRAGGDGRYLGIAASAPPSGTAGGDLSGTYPNPTAIKASGAFAVTGALTGTTASFVGSGSGNYTIQRTGVDSSVAVLFAGATNAVRFGLSAAGATVEGVDSTGIGSYQPLALNGTRVDAPTPIAASNDTQIATTAWVKANAAAATSGDFSATNSASLALGGSFSTLVPNTVRSGNSGSWYSTSTGRYTPPAGRYAISATCSALAGGAGSSLQIQITKNGTQIAFAVDTTTAGAWASCALSPIVDANGTDYFEIQGQFSGSTSSANTVLFSGFPVSGIKGPAGDPGTPLAQNAQTGNYTLVLGDANGHIYHAVGAGAGDTYTIPANSSVAYPIGTTLTFVNDDATNSVAIAITTDTMVLSPGTTTGSRTLATGGMATALKVTATRWIISGTGLT